MDREREDGRVPTSEFAGVEQVGEFGLAVARPRGSRPAEVVLLGVEGGEDDSGGGVGAGCDGCQGDDAWGGRALEGGEEQFDEQGMGDVVDAEMLLVAVRGATRGDGHDSGIEDQGGEGAGLGEHGPTGGLHGAEGVLVTGDEGDSDVGGDSVHRRDDVFGRGGRTSREEDM